MALLCPTEAMFEENVTPVDGLLESDIIWFLTVRED